MSLARYAEGTPILVGDRVRIEHGRTDAIVEYLVLTPDDMAAHGALEPSVMLLSEPFGRVLWSLDTHDDPVAFVARGALPDILPET